MSLSLERQQGLSHLRPRNTEKESVCHLQEKEVVSIFIHTENTMEFLSLPKQNAMGGLSLLEEKYNGEILLSSKKI